MLNNIILASKSKVRKEILDKNNIKSAVVPSNVDEDIVKISLLKEMMTSCDVPGYSGCCAAVRDMKLTHQLSKINNPTLIIAGELDPSTPVAHSEIINREINSSNLIVIGGVAHLSNIEKPAEFNEAILDFLLDEGLSL